MMSAKSIRNKKHNIIKWKSTIDDADQVIDLSASTRRSKKFRIKVKKKNMMKGKSKIDSIDDVELKKFFVAANREGWSVLVEREWVAAHRRQPHPEEVPPYSSRLAYYVPQLSPRRRCILLNDHISADSPATATPPKKQIINLPNLPTLSDYNYFKCILTAPPPTLTMPQSQCLVFFLAEFSPHVLFCRLGDHKWTLWPYDEDQARQFLLVDAVTCNGRLFACNEAATLYEIVIGPAAHQLPHVQRYQIRGLVNSGFERVQLVDSCGQLFVVRRKFMVIIKVCKLYFSMNEWKSERVTDLGGRDFFLMGNYSASVDHQQLLGASATGNRNLGNKIFFTDNVDDQTLYMFDLKDSSLSIWNNSNSNSGGFWVYHDVMLPTINYLCDRHRGDNEDDQVINKQERVDEDDHQIMNKQVERVDEDDQVINKHEEEGIGESIVGCSKENEKGGSNSIWGVKLGEDVQKLIAQRLLLLPSTLDYMNFRSVCKGWRSIAPPIRWKPNLAVGNGNGIPLKHPWLMFSSSTCTGLGAGGGQGSSIIINNNNEYSLYDPISNVRHCITIPELQGCRILFSNHGWLLVAKLPRTIFFFEPFTRTKIQLPDLTTNVFDGICFSKPPTCSDCQIFAITYIRPGRFLVMFLPSPNYHGWVARRIDENRTFLPCVANPVFDGESFCCLGRNGALIYFKFTIIMGGGGADDEEGLNIDDVHAVGITMEYYSWSMRFLSSSCRRYLVCHNGQLMSVFVDHMGRSTHVFRRDEKAHQWVEINSLGEDMLYLSQTTCVGVDAGDQKFLRNTLQFSMFSTNQVGSSSSNMISYCLNNRRYQTCDCPHQAISSSSQHLYDSKELLDATWIHPLLVPVICY